MAGGSLSLGSNSNKGCKGEQAALALHQPPQLDQQRGKGDWAMGYVVSYPEDWLAPRLWEPEEPPQGAKIQAGQKACNTHVPTKACFS